MDLWIIATPCVYVAFVVVLWLAFRTEIKSEGSKAWWKVVRMSLEHVTIVLPSDLYHKVKLG